MVGSYLANGKSDFNSNLNKLCKARNMVGIKNRVYWLKIEVLTLVQNLKEKRLRHTRGPVQFTESVTLIYHEFSIAIFVIVP